MRLTNIGHATIAIESKGVTLLTDPWLTNRLDRFWEHHPPMVGDSIPARVDVILLSHHHVDHFHLPSLHRLNRDALVIYPATPNNPVVGPSGAGSLAIPWVLRRLGFHSLYALAPFEAIQVDHVSIATLPSDVTFPEYAYIIGDGECTAFLAGDSVLHSKTVQWIKETKRVFDLAVVPVHSISDTDCFTTRSGRKNESLGNGRIRRIAEENFRTYLARIPARAILPGAFGWRVVPDPVTPEPQCSWMNHKLFPLTPAQGYQLGIEMDLPMHTWQPGDSVEPRPFRDPEGQGEHWDDVEFLEEASREIRHDPATPTPDFEPNRIGPPLSEKEHEETVHFVENGLIDLLVPTSFFMRASELGTRLRLRVTGFDDMTWTIDFGRTERMVVRESGTHENTPLSVWVAERSLLRMIRSELPYAHTWGHWLTNNNLLDFAFNQPQFYMRYVERLVEHPEKMITYGL